MVQVRDFNFASVTFDHELKQFLVVRNFNPRASVALGVMSRVHLRGSAVRVALRPLRVASLTSAIVLRFSCFVA